MTRPPWEVADIIHRAGNKFFERYCDSLTWTQLKVLRAIARCRTAALGGHRDQCVRCEHQAISYNSCRNRHCPKCQTNAREKWLRARRQELLPVGYFHLVFSVPHALVPLIWQNKRYLFGLLFDTSAATLLEVAADPARLGAEIGFRARLEGQRIGRPRINVDREGILRDRASGRSLSELAKTYGTSGASVVRVLQQGQTHGEAA